MWKFVRHWWRKTFRGSVVTFAEHSEGGRLVQYQSGYVEHQEPQPDGTLRVTDVEMDLYLQAHQRNDWTVVAFGGGSVLVLRNVTRDEAMTRVAKEYGTVSYVDDSGRHIFYKPWDWRPAKLLES